MGRVNIVKQVKVDGKWILRSCRRKMIMSYLRKVEMSY